MLGKEFTVDRYGVEMPEFASAAYRQAATAINLGQAYQLLAARQKLRTGQDPVAQAVAELERTTGGRTDAIAEIQAAREGYLAAAAAFEEMRRKARANVRDLALWVEGVRLNIFYADFLLAAVAGELPARASEFLERLSRLREQTSGLFSDTYEARSVEEELDLRYGFHADYLRGLAHN